MQGARVRSLVRELDPACMPQLRVCMLQLKMSHATIKTRHSQKKKKKNKALQPSDIILVAEEEELPMSF